MLFVSFFIYIYYYYFILSFCVGILIPILRQNRTHVGSTWWMLKWMEDMLFCELSYIYIYISREIYIHSSRDSCCCCCRCYYYYCCLQLSLFLSPRHICLVNIKYHLKFSFCFLLLFFLFFFLSYFRSDLSIS